MLAKKSLLTRVWMASGKRVYYWLTRGVLRTSVDGREQDV